MNATTPFKLWSRNFVGVCASSFLYFGSFYMLMPVLPIYVSSLGGTAAQIGLVVGLFTCASIIIRPYFGKLADRHGLRKFMLMGSGLFALVFTGYGYMSAILPLYLLRILHGLAHGIYLAAAFAYVGDLAPVNRRGEVMGIYGVANVVSMAIFPAVGTYIVSYTDSFSFLFVAGLVMAAGAFLTVWRIDEKKPAVSGTPSIPVITVMKQKAVVVASLTFGTAATAYGSIITFLPVYAPLQGIHEFGAFFTVYALFTLLSRIIAGKLSDKVGRFKVILPFLVLIALSMGLLTVMSSTAIMLTIAALFGLGFGAFMPALNAYVVDETRPEERSSALAVFTAFMDVGITSGAVLLGVVGERQGYSAMFGWACAVVVAGLILFATLGRPQNRTERI